MYNFSLQSIYYKNIIKSNFINNNMSWVSSKNTSFDNLLISFQCSPKKYNKKMFIVLVMLMEYLTRGVSMNKNKLVFISKNKKSFLRINVNYLVPLNKMYILLDNFINTFYWMDLDESMNFLKNKNIININKKKIISLYITKLLDLTHFIQNKIQFEKYFLKKKYKLVFYFLPCTKLYYSWWLKLVGFHNFKNEINL